MNMNMGVHCLESIWGFFNVSQKPFDRAPVLPITGLSLTKQVECSKHHTGDEDRGCA